MPTDSMNSLSGPALLQVFPSHLYEPVMRNLTDEATLLARLTRVPVLRNDYLGVSAGQLDELLLFSNARPDAFLRSFDDASRITAALSGEWPDRIILGMPPLDANMICQLERWKLAKHAAAVRSLFGA